MLVQNLYRIINFSNEGQIIGGIEVNKTHEVFKGHFPAMPILPGVCMVQMVKELVEKAEGKKCFLFSGSNIKFMAMMNPFDNDRIEAEVKITAREGDVIAFSSQLKNGERVILKFSGKLRLVA